MNENKTIYSERNQKINPSGEFDKFPFNRTNPEGLFTSFID